MDRMKSIEIISVNISEQKGEIKLPTEKIILTKEGISGDAHAGNGTDRLAFLGLRVLTGFLQLPAEITIAANLPKT